MINSSIGAKCISCLTFPVQVVIFLVPAHASVSGCEEMLLLCPDLKGTFALALAIVACGDNSIRQWGAALCLSMEPFFFDVGRG